jgi:hypothetical protein
MKSDSKKCMSLPSVCLAALAVLLVPCHGQAPQGCEVAIAVLNLPDGSDGLLHWREAGSVTTPLQLSTRYFSAPVKLKGDAILFHKEPVPAGMAPRDAPAPLLAVKVPVGMKRGYLVLWTEPGEDDQTRWQGRLLSATDWKTSSMKVMNVSSETIGIAAGGKRIQLAPGKAMDFHAAEWREPFPVKFFRMQPELKTIFSSTWRVTEGRRELCFIGEINGAISLRSLLELNAPPG